MRKLSKRCDLFDEDQQFHFSHGPEYDDGDDFQDYYQSDDNKEEEKDRDESALEEGVERTMFAKSLGDNIIQGDVQWKRVETYKTNPKGYVMPKTDQNDEGSMPVKLEASNAMDIKKVCTEQMEEISDSL